MLIPRVATCDAHRPADHYRHRVTAGTGRAVARRLLEAGATVVDCARDAGRLDAVAVLRTNPVAACPGPCIAQQRTPGAADFP